MTRDGRLSGKVAVVTGASRGIGRAIALAFARQGARLVVTYRHEEKLAEAVAREVAAYTGEVLTVRLDVCDRESVRAMLARACERFGRLDVLVNNAGFLEQKPFADITDGDWDQALSVNLKGVFLCTQEAMPVFERQKSGCIVNISSVGGQMGGPKAPHYAAAKAGVISFTKSTARILASSGVRVNAVAPGFIRTDMYGEIVARAGGADVAADVLLGRVGEPEEVAAAVVFLASDDASYVTGHVLNVNGGSYLGAGS